MANYTRTYTYKGSSETKLQVTLKTINTSITDNTTTENVIVKFIHTGTSFNNTPRTATLKFNGQTRPRSFSYSGATTITLWDFNQVVPHNADGKKTVTLTITDDRDNHPFTTTISVNATFVLDTVLRNATFTSVPDNIDFTKPFEVNIDRRGATTVDIGIYNISGGGTFVPYIEDIEGTSFTFTLDETERNRFYADMPNATKKYRFYLKSNIGDIVYSEKTFVITGTNGYDQPTVPVFTQKDTNVAIAGVLTNTNQTFIQNNSDLQVTLTEATAPLGATIKKYIITNGSTTKEYDTHIGAKDIGKITSSILQVKVIDSRDIERTATKTLNYIEYTPPLIQSFNLERQIGATTRADFFVSGKYNPVNFGKLTNTITSIKYRKKTLEGSYGGWTTITSKATIGGGGFNNVANQYIDGFTFGVEYVVEIEAKDRLTFTTATTTVTKGMFTMLINKQYGSVGIGETPLNEENTLIVKGNVYAPNIGNNIFNENTEYNSVGLGTLPKEEENSLTVAGNVYAPNIGVESGSNANGEWTKFADGTMICTNTWKIVNTAITTARGQVFGSAQITPPNFPVAFIAIPNTTYTMKSQDVSPTRLFWISGGAGTGRTNSWTFVLLREFDKHKCLCKQWIHSIIYSNR